MREEKNWIKLLAKRCLPRSEKYFTHFKVTAEAEYETLLQNGVWSLKKTFFT